MRSPWLWILLLASCDPDQRGAGDARDLSSPALPDEGAGDLTAVSACANGIKDVRETDVDCGGLDCALCGDQRTCLGNYDCQSQRCVAGRCTSCPDSILDGGGGDVDCGGG